MSTKVEQICAAIGRYYLSLDKEYNGQFSSFCDENALDDDTLQEELQQTPEDCLLVDFDEEFPFEKPLDENDQAKIIFDLIVKCWEDPQCKFIPKNMDISTMITKGLFQYDQKELDDMAAVVKSTCPTYKIQDECSLTFLLIERKKHFPLLRYMMDAYQIARIKNGINVEKREFTELKKNEWLKKQEVTKLLEKIPVKDNDAAHMLSAAMALLNKRVCKLMLFSPEIVINESLELTVKYIRSAINEIGRQLKQKSTTPFQLDFVLVTETTKKSKQMENKDNNDEDEDEDDDDDEKVGDKQGQKNEITSFGNIEDKLKNSKWAFVKQTIKNKDFFYDPYCLRETMKVLLQEFIKISKNEYNGTDNYLKQKRLIFVLDRRNQALDESSPIYLSSSPETNIIPKDGIYEWHFDATQMHISPQIGALFDCNGSLLTFSFHVTQSDVMKLYFYWDNGITRFLPSFIPIVFPMMFAMTENDGKWGEENDNWIKNVHGNELDGIIKEMNTALNDIPFEGFLNSNYISSM
eukprot:502867_1